MASPYPPFIFQDAIPAQQMQAHAQAVNEGMRIAELGKARQAEGMFRMAQLQQQQRAQQEKNALDRMIAESQIAQNRISNEFRDRQLTQTGELAREQMRSTEKIYSQGGLMNPSARTELLKQEYNDRMAKEADADALRVVQETEQALQALDRLETQYRSVQSSGSKNLNLPVLQQRLGEIITQKRNLIKGMSDKGYDWDPLNKRFTGVARPKTVQSAMQEATGQTGVPSFQALPASALSQPAAQSPLAPTPTAELSPFAMRVGGISPGQVIEQGGQSFTATPAFAPNESPMPQSALTGDPTLDEMMRRYPGVNFVRDGNAIRAGGFEWDDGMRRIAEDPSLTPQLKESMIASYIRRKYPDLFQDQRDAFQRYGTPIGRGVMSLIGR